MNDLECMLLIGVLTFLFVRVMDIFETRRWPSENVTTLFGAIRELFIHS
jgi:hypothetical protein